MEIKKKIILLFFSMTIGSCGHYVDFKYSKKLYGKYYLAESEMLPNKFICLNNQDSYLVLVKNVVELWGNQNLILVKSYNKKELTYHFYKLDLDEAKYPEDVNEIDINDFNSIKNETSVEYHYDESEGFVRYSKKEN